jgi:hypothetical protein
MASQLLARNELTRTGGFSVGASTAGVGVGTAMGGVGSGTAAAGGLLGSIVSHAASAASAINAAQRRIITERNTMRRSI